jgi:hypothetical protein
MKPTKAHGRLSPVACFGTSAGSDTEEEKDWTGAELGDLDHIVTRTEDSGTSPLLSVSGPDPMARRELVDPPGGSIRFAAVKDCPRHVNVALGAVAGIIAGGMTGGVVGVVVKQATALAGEAADAAIGGGVAAGAALGATIYAVLEMWGEKCA